MPNNVHLSMPCQLAAPIIDKLDDGNRGIHLLFTQEHALISFVVTERNPMSRSIGECEA